MCITFDNMVQNFITSLYLHFEKQKQKVWIQTLWSIHSTNPASPPNFEDML